MGRSSVRPGAALLAIVAALAAPPAGAQQHDHGTGRGHVISLDSILADIDARNPSLSAARHHADALDFVPDQASAWSDPVVGLGYQPVPMLTAHGAQRTQWSVEQTIPFPGRLSLRREIASLDSDVAELESEALLDDLILSAKEAYYELYRLERTERLIIEFGSALESFEEAAAVRYEVGQGPQQALLRAQLEKNQVAQRLHHVEGARRRAAETLARLTNRPEGPRYFLTARPTPPHVARSEPASLAREAFERRPELAALRAAGERAAREVELARMEKYPDVSLSITYHDIAARDEPAGATGRDAVSIGASVRIPLQRSRIRARVAEARLHQSRIEAQQEALRTEYRTTIEELLAVLEHEEQAIDEYETILLPQAASVVEATQSAYGSGIAGYLDLLDAERTMFALRTAYVDAEHRLLTAAARLERVLGTGLSEAVPDMELTTRP